MNVNFSLLLV